ncbi:TPA: phage tail assembly protein [Escherichia coli]|uniref:phage tail assembly protein n=1 Tax=Escherichia coli TaxID=562 RepID=UPI0010300765|nr:phage tail assembly protein [Escherichia coli]EER0851829.1 phage tail assembly protein [Escherichia coli]EES7735040.1 phage tail assembly protein [Escherichia coli]EEY6096400.1 phage tail assembly protein [Escherichia coli]EFE0754734.1 phage tail assembly protein [Escherichia coli]EFG0709811.1 phage tail assembly protein [Escherichia coli]
MSERKTVTLNTPLKRGETEFVEFQIRKPLGGDLRGVSLVELLSLNVDALTSVLPRITAPALNKHEVAQLDFIDLTAFGTALVGFLPQTSPEAADTPDA